MQNEFSHWKDLRGKDIPWPILLSCATKDVENIDFDRRSEEESVVRFIRGERCDNEVKVFQEFAAALQFPYYFGNNWSALDECLRDLEWIQGAQYVITITHADHILREAAEERFEVLLRILGKAAHYWSNPDDLPWATEPIPFHVVFHCEPEMKQTLVERIQRCDVSPFEITNAARG